jgi:integrase
VKAGELKPRTYQGYESGLAVAVKFFGAETPVLNIPVGKWQEYRNYLATTYDVHTVARHIGAIRSLSKWAVQNEYVDRPFRFGTEFNLPSQKALRAAKTEAGDRTYTPAQVEKVLASESKVLRAMFLLSLNGGVGNTDLSELKDGNIKADRIEFSRSKTGVARVIPLWPETSDAIKESRDVRPNAKTPEFDDRIFLTETGLPYVRDNLDGEGNLTSTTDKIATLFWKEMKTLSVPRTFYDGRRTFQTIGDEVGPPHVVRFIMGHATRGDDMSSRYRQSIPHSQLLAVVMHVRTRLHVAKCFASAKAKASKSAGSKAKALPAAKSDKPQRRQSKNAK